MTTDQPRPPKLVPELLVTSIEESLAFYRDKLGFTVQYARPEEAFAYLDREGAQLMLSEPVGRLFLVGELFRPYGVGMNPQIEVADIEALYIEVSAQLLDLMLPLDDSWYRRDDELTGNRQFVIVDPDGYVLRFFQDLGTRPVEYPEQGLPTDPRLQSRLERGAGGSSFF